MHPSEILATETVRPLSVAEYDHLAENGAFENEKVELLEGLIVEMSPQGPRQFGVIIALTEVLTESLDRRATVAAQGPLRTGAQSKPEPDVAVVPRGRYMDAHPAQAHLVVEVAESSLRKDRLLKSRIYAAAGVPEYWVIDLNECTLERMTVPQGEFYTHTETLGRGDRVSLVDFPDVQLSLDAILP